MIATALAMPAPRLRLAVAGELSADEPQVLILNDVLVNAQSRPRRLDGLASGGAR